jgi:uncharacterized Zn finger protein
MKNDMSYWDWGYYKPKPAKQAKGGIKAQSKRGAFGETWWAKRWIAVLESFDIGARLGRGRSYARSGQVLSIEITKGEIKSQVQGSRPRPYDIEIKIKALPGGDWRKLADALSSQAIFAAKLLAGEMPHEIEQSFEEVGLSLFPARLGDLQTNCSCPDWSNPCKHIAAVYYLIGEEFDRDPFLIFKLRGATREEFIELLGSAGAGETEGLGDGATGRLISSPSPAVSPSLSLSVAPSPAEPLVTETESFWAGAALPDDFFGEVSLPVVTAALPRRLGNFPFWRGEARFLEAIAPVYTQAALHGLNVFLGERGANNDD